MREGDGRERSIPLPRAARAILAATALATLATLLTAAAVAPSAWAALRSRREYDLQLARRSQLGERLTALVQRLVELERRGQAVERSVARAATVYGLEPEPESRVASPSPPRTPAVESIYVSTRSRGTRLAASLAARLARAGRLLDRLAVWESAHPEEAALAPVRWPLEAELAVPTSGVGPRRGPAGEQLEFHAGLDLAAEEGTQIVAAGAGTVVWAGEPPGDAGPAWWRLGRIVAVRHGERFLSLYGHCGSVETARGRRVERGDPVARVGATGWTAVPQLHFEIRRRDAAGAWEVVDPREFLLGRDLPGPPTPAPGSGAVPPSELPRAFQR